MNEADSVYSTNAQELAQLEREEKEMLQKYKDTCVSGASSKSGFNTLNVSKSMSPAKAVRAKAYSSQKKMRPSANDDDFNDRVDLDAPLSSIQLSQQKPRTAKVDMTATLPSGARSNHGRVATNQYMRAPQAVALQQSVLSNGDASRAGGQTPSAKSKSVKKTQRALVDRLHAPVQTKLRSMQAQPNPSAWAAPASMSSAMAKPKAVKAPAQPAAQAKVQQAPSIAKTKE